MNLTEKEKEILLAFAENNMNLNSTARSLYVHRNTVYYHFGNIKEKTGLAPRNFYDLVELVDLVTMEEING